MKQKNSPAENEIIAAEEAEDSSKGGEAFQKILLFMITVFLSTVAAYLYGRSWMELIGTAVLSACGAGMILFSIEKSRVLQLFLYDNERNLWRFTLLYCIFLLAALLCPLLPKAGWPYLAVFVGLMLFSNEVTGLAAGSSLLMISLLLQNEAEPVTFFVYFVGGMAGILLFSTINESFHIWLPVLLSLLLQFVCLCIPEVLYQQLPFYLPMLLVPAVNTVVCLILLLIILKFFSFTFIYKTRDIYMDINDPECPLLVELKNVSKPEYYHTIHTAYLCSRIALQLKLDDAVVKACAYYHKIGLLKGENNWENVEQILAGNQIPLRVRELLKQYLSPAEQLVDREVIVLLFADTVISSIDYLFSKDKNVQLDYQKLIQTIYKRKMESGILDHSEISFGDLQKMKQILVDERLYYDFLR